MRDSVATAIARLDGWLETMRGSAGYTGPIAHWWESTLLYCGPMIDWRYEGVLCGYTSLARHSPSDEWLQRAVTAADDAVAAQLPDGRFARSSFQIGPLEGGTPHEAAVDVGLLALANELDRRQDPRGHRYAEVAVRNVEQFQLRRLWDGHGFCDQPGSTTRVPNKNATVIDALLAYQGATGVDAAEYIAGAVGVIESAIVEGEGIRSGGTVHLGTHRHRLVIPFYTARCVGAVASLDASSQEERYRRLGVMMTEFLVRSYERDGFVFGYYADQRPIANPRWVAASGEILRALILAERCWNLGLSPVIDRIVSELTLEQKANGSWATGVGFARRGMSRPHHGVQDLRDVLPVVGWNDKVLRALALYADHSHWEISPAQLSVPAVTEICSWKGRQCEFSEDERHMRLVGRRGRVLYEWVKGEDFPRCYSL